MDQNATRKTGIFTMQEWIDRKLSDAENEVVIGTSQHAIVRPFTKNFISGPEKSFKTTLTLRLMAGLSCGKTVFPSMPVPRARKVLYLHGELSDAEIKDRTISASQGIPGPYNNLLQGRSLDVHLVTKNGQVALEEIVREYTPDDVILDPWQSFISGYDENGFKDMSNATTFCNYLIEEYKITLWIPIHLGKDPKKGPRGHSTISGWRDTLIQLKRLSQNDNVQVTVEPRWGVKPQPFQLHLENGTMWPSENAVSFSFQREKIRSFVQNQGGRVPKAAVAEYLGIGSDAARKAIERACDAGAVSPDGEFLTVE